MAPKTSKTSPREVWQEELQEAHRRGENKTSFGFKEVVSNAFLDKIDSTNPLDPIGLQVFPRSAEEASNRKFTGSKNPVGEFGKVADNGLVRKYKGRVLVLLSSQCPVHCRYCFRRHFPYREKPFSLRRLDEVKEKLEADDSIREVILSGGDPLSASDHVLGEAIRSLGEVAHIRALRIHSRYATALPSRFTASLMRSLREWRRQKVFVSHVNHPNELDDASKRVFSLLRNEGWTLLNQSVLLRQVNDDLRALVDLSWRLFGQGVLPYYLHQFDEVLGAEHFSVSVERGRELAQGMRRELPGYLVPRYVVEVFGRPSKEPV